VCFVFINDQDEQTIAFSSNTTRTWTLKMRMSQLILAGSSGLTPHQEKTMSHAPTTTKGSERGVPIPSPAGLTLFAHEAHRTMIRLGIAAIAVACWLIAVSGDAKARQETPVEERAYCTRLHSLFWKYHANFFHHDGTWVRAELARSDCDHGKLEPATGQIEIILRHDLFVVPADRSPTYTGFAYP
jgi:hypothetical protein